MIAADNIHFLSKRENSIWGDFSLVEATINCIKYVVDNNMSAGYTILLSGNCYPIVSNQAINHFFEANGNKNYIDVNPIGEAWQNIDERLSDYTISLSGKRGDLLTLPPFAAMKPGELKKLIVMIFKRRKFRSLKLGRLFSKRVNPIPKSFGGSQWWAFSGSTLIKIANFINKNREYYDFHRNTLVPDEIFFHTIIKTLQDTDPEIQIASSVTYVNWSRPNCPLPVLFTKDDMEEITTQIKNNKLFARKFDMEIDTDILDIIDAHRQTDI